MGAPKAPIAVSGLETRPAVPRKRMSRMSRDAIDPSKLGYRPCVGIMVLNRQGLVWVGRRADAPGDSEGRGSWWQMPQGGIDEGEDPAAAALRELEEETGMTSVAVLGETPGWLRYDLPAHLVGKAWKGKYRGQEQKWYAVRFLGSDAEINITPAEPHQVEFDAWRWVALSELEALIVPFKREVYRQVAAAFAPYAGGDA
jgi:putative (di)nucleoside polyphosphate hydrolase